MGSEFIWFWIAIEQNNKEIIGFSQLKVVVAERFLSNFTNFRRDMANIQVQEVIWKPSIHKPAFLLFFLS